MAFVYMNGSIYSATKDVEADWLVERMASGTNVLLVRAGTVDVEIGFGRDEDEAKQATYTVPAGSEQYLNSRELPFVAWRGAVGTVFMEQSVARWS